MARPRTCPEQLAGREATVRSDLYALGLVLYELFTGKAPFTARGVEELARQRESHPATTPSTLVPDLDAKIERAILRCLEPDPELRPASASEVSAAPAGDPLAEALAAGQTPSPEVVAAAGETEGLRPGLAIALAISTAVCLGLVLTLTPEVMMLGYLPLQHPPDELRIEIVHDDSLPQWPNDWSPDGRFLDHRGMMMTADVKDGPVFEASAPRPLFQSRFGQFSQFDVSRDGGSLFLYQWNRPCRRSSTS